MEQLDLLADIGVDGVIVQDWGLYALARRLFPRLPLHASTQMAAHSTAGVRTLATRGFSRVVLARELTLDEIADAVRHGNAEIEVFIHGALCYSYSGLCLFSSHATGRSGNRGQCAYCCRARLRAADTFAHPFSMRDLAWLEHLPRLRATGVASLKIEGRMKSPLYVAAVTDLYRHALDGRLTPELAARKIADLQTIFSRPWTALYANGPDAPPETVIDPDAVGHRGAFVGRAQTVLRDHQGQRWLRFHTGRPLEKHDGLQVEPAGGGQPCGFAVNLLRRFPGNRPLISVDAGCDVEIALPADLAFIPAPGDPIYCTASQAVRRAFAIPILRESSIDPPRTCSVSITLASTGIQATARADDDHADNVTLTIPATLAAARAPQQTADAVFKAFMRSREQGWRVCDIGLHDPAELYAPPSLLNETRRQLLTLLSDKRTMNRAARRRTALDEIPPPVSTPQPPSAITFAAKIHHTQEPCPELANADELVLQIGHLPLNETTAVVNRWSAIIPRQNIRLALPLITRNNDAARLRQTVATLLRDGWRKWEVASLCGLELLRELAPEADITADWPLYTLNRAAVRELLRQGVSRCVSSPEETLENLIAHSTGPTTEALVLQHTPLFIAHTAPCAATDQATATRRQFSSRQGAQLQTDLLDGLWITTSTTVFSAAAAMPRLLNSGITRFRCDWSWRPLPAPLVADEWHAIRNNTPPANSHDANFIRGLGAAQ